MLPVALGERRAAMALPRSRVEVGDRGNGIRRTLAQNPAHANLTSDVAAILRGVDLGVSEHAEVTRGNGLYHLRRLVAQHRGALHTRSGCGKVYYPVDRLQPLTFAPPSRESAPQT